MKLKDFKKKTRKINKINVKVIKTSDSKQSRDKNNISIAFKIN